VRSVNHIKHIAGAVSDDVRNPNSEVCSRSNFFLFDWPYLRGQTLD
jgi:hypothetical protein